MALWMRDSSHGSSRPEALYLLHLLDELVGAELAAHHLDELLDGVLAAVHVKESAADHGQTRRVNLLQVDLDVLLQVVSVQVQHEVVHVVKAVAHDDQKKLIHELGLLQEILDVLWVGAVQLPADALNSFDLSSHAYSL